MEWMSAKEAEKLWGITSRRVQALCDNGQIESAARLGKIWVIPKTAQKLIDGRTKASKKAAAEKTKQQKDGGNKDEKI